MTAQVRRSARLAAKVGTDAGVGSLLVALPDKRPLRANASRRSVGARQQHASRPTTVGRRRPRRRHSDVWPRLDVDDLPDEILWLVLGDFTEPPWHAAVAHVSRRWRGIVLAWAARFERGSLQCPLTLRQSTMRTAIRSNARSVAVWLRDQCGCPMGPWAFDSARCCDYAWWVRWLRAPSEPCPWDPTALRYAVSILDDGNLLRWMRAQPDPCPWHPSVCAAAAEIDSMRFSVRDRTHVERKRRGRRRAIDSATTQTNDGASPGAGIHGTRTLAWLRAQDPPCPWDESTCAAAAWYADMGGFKVLRWLRAQDPPCPWDKHTLTALVFRGTVDTFVWAYDRGAPCDESVLCTAVSKGRLDLLAAVLDRCGDATTPKGRAMWTPRVFVQIAYADDAVALGTWLLGVASCRVDGALCSRLAQCDKVDALAWARARGFALDAPYACYMAAAHGATAALAWLRDVERVDVDTVRDGVRYATYGDARRVSAALSLLDLYWPNANLQAIYDALARQ
ncbi:hypothetical protein psal_cds_189 [Pandoravirus salinus]|uniref:F-box incomplete domain containing protein n=1 Tax=Pandoravirus salinus TaxID=1349410 RepID=S4VTP3_9VIRU|nr:hypothetical protein psal_cds_189 [Pandoravirus salinus]AGO83693.1 hypothetical protein psal_cds_189 [Pandoravirus salinus]